MSANSGHGYTMAEARPVLWFCFPYRGVGGVSLLFLRLAEELARTGAADVTLVDYADGYMARNRRAIGVTVAEYRDDGALMVPSDAVLVFQSMSPWSIFPGIAPDPATRVLFWTCFPFNLVPPLPGARGWLQHRPRAQHAVLATALRGYRAAMRRFVRLLDEREAVVFMDAQNLATTEEMLGLKIASPQFLPIPAPVAAPRLSVPTGEPLRVVWVGRIVDFKVHVLRHALAALNAIAQNGRDAFAVTIVGSGDHAAWLRDEALQFTGLAIEWIDELAPEAVETLLATRTDLLMAMGTAALDGARLGVPVLLLDMAYGPLPPDYRFRWLHEARGFSLGDIAERSGASRELGSMARRIAELRADPQGLGECTLTHFAANHALPSIAARIIGKAHATRCQWGDLTASGLLQRGAAYTLFRSIRKAFSRT